MPANYVEFDIPNLKIAREFIIANADAVSEIIVRQIGTPQATMFSLGMFLRPLSERGFRYVIASFMSRYPRAKGTKGEPLLRQFWAACYAFKRVRSIPHRAFGWNGNRLPIIWFYDDNLRPRKERYNGVTIGRVLEGKIVEFDDMGRALPSLSLTELQSEKLVLKGLLGYDFDGNYLLTDAGLAKREATLKMREADAKRAEQDREIARRANTKALIERLAKADVFDENEFMQLRGMARDLVEAD